MSVTLLTPNVIEICLFSRYNISTTNYESLGFQTRVWKVSQYAYLPTIYSTRMIFYCSVHLLSHEAMGEATRLMLVGHMSMTS